MNPIDKIILKQIRNKVSRWFDLERSLTKIPDSYGATEWSPEKTWPDPEKIPLGGEVPFSLRNIFLREKCLPIFVSQEGCTVCVKECPFSRRSYDDIHESFRNMS